MYSVIQCWIKKLNNAVMLGCSRVVTGRFDSEISIWCLYIRILEADKSLFVIVWFESLRRGNAKLFQHDRVALNCENVV
jgi:hypothetical protein